MATYLTNLSQTSTLTVKIKETYLDIKSGESIAVGKSDVDAGTFEDVVNRGLAKLVFDVKKAPEPMYPQTVIPVQAHWGKTGMSTEEASAYLATQSPANTQKVAGKVTSFGQK